MSEEKKYYTPTIEEFHVGFECEYMSVSKEWIPTKTTISIDAQMDFDGDPIFGLDIPFINKMLGYAEPSIRVKFLDTDDIKELGWKIEVNNPNNFKFMHKTIFKRWLYFYPPSNSIRIFDANYSSSDYLFSGKIKNKFEFKRLMNQLEIHE